MAATMRVGPTRDLLGVLRITSIGSAGSTPGRGCRQFRLDVTAICVVLELGQPLLT